MFVLPKKRPSVDAHFILLLHHIRYQRGNQNPHVDKPIAKKKRDKQRSTKHTHNTNDRVAQSPRKPRG